MLCELPARVADILLESEFWLLPGCFCLIGDVYGAGYTATTTQHWNTLRSTDSTTTQKCHTLGVCIVACLLLFFFVFFVVVVGACFFFHRNQQLFWPDLGELHWQRLRCQFTRHLFTTWCNFSDLIGLKPMKTHRENKN